MAEWVKVGWGDDWRFIYCSVEADQSILDFPVETVKPKSDFRKTHGQSQDTLDILALMVLLTI